MMQQPLEYALLAALAAGRPISGAQLAQRLGVTRAAIWKHVASLRESGLPIEARPGIGYRLPWPTQLLDADKISAALRDPLPAPLRVHWQLDSTQDALARGQSAWPDLSVILCERQTNGRGRRGRSWQAPPALNLCLSCLKRFPGGPASLSGLSIAVGVCVVRALVRAGARGLCIKWPNDIMADSAKLCGILIEVNGEAEGPSTARIGIGLNVRLPAGTRRALDQPATDLATLCHDAPPDRNHIAALVIQALYDGLIDFENEGLTPFLKTFAALDGLRDRPLRIQDPRGTRYGVGCGIDGTGALLVKLDDAITPIYGGDVSVRVARA